MKDIRVNSGVFENGKHYYPVFVCYNHTDMGGIVYFANYLRMTEEARMALFTKLGESDKDGYTALKQTGDFVVRSCQAEYLKSAILGDNLIVETTLSELGRSYIILSQDIYRGDEKLVEMKFKLVFVRITSDGSHRPSRVPEFWLDKLDAITVK